jgi:hypothetical protein
VVYHGLAGHHLVKGISHVLKVRILGKKEDRVHRVMQRAEIFEQAASAMKGMPGQGLTAPASHRRISKDRAERILEDSEEARRKWGFHLYGIDTYDPRIYDLVIHLDRLSVDDAANVICHAARLTRFQATAESQQAMDDLVFASRIKANLVERYPRIKVTANKGSVYVALEGGGSGEEKAIQNVVSQIPGVKRIAINVYPFATPD